MVRIKVTTGFRYFLLGAILFCWLELGYCLASASPITTTNLEILVKKWASPKSFRMAPDTVDSLIKGICKTQRERRDAQSTYVKYTCDPTSGVGSLEYDIRNDRKNGPYVMYLNVHFAATRYGDVKNVIVRKMGMPRKETPGYARWGVSGDAWLNRLGYPVIYVSRGQHLDTATFAVVLEQGESEQ